MNASISLQHMGYKLDVDFIASDTIIWMAASPMPSFDEIEATYKPAAAALIAERIKADRDRRKSAGTPVGPYVFHSDPDSRIQQLGLVMMGASIPAGIMWKTKGTGYVEMTPTLAQQIFGATATRDVTLFSVADAHITAAAASDDPLAYDYNTGWPE